MSRAVHTLLSVLVVFSWFAVQVRGSNVEREHEPRRENAEA